MGSTVQRSDLMTDLSFPSVQTLLLLVLLILLGLVIYLWFFHTTRANLKDHKRNEKYRNLFEQAGDGIIVHDLQGKILDVNPAVCKLFGYSPEQFCRLHISQLHPDKPDVVEISRAAFKMISRDTEIKFENEFITSSGEILIGEVTSTIIHEPDGNYVHAVFRNSTARQQAENTLRKQNRIYLSLLENVNAITWELELSTGLFNYVSPNAKRILGYPLSDWADMQSWLDMVIEEDQEFASSFCSAETKAGRDHSFEYRMRKQNGDVIWVLDLVRVVKNEAGKPIKLAGVIFDNTDQHHMATALKESRRAYKEAQETAHLGYWQIDIKSGKAFWSDDIYNMLGLNPKQEVGPEFLSTIVNPEDWPAVSDSLRNAIDSGQKHEIEYRVKSQLPESHELWLYCKAERVLDDKGNPERLSGIVQDITERKQTELALRDSETFLQDVFHAIQDGIIVLDTDFNIIRTNRWMEEHYRHLMPLAGRKCYQIFRDRDELCDSCPSHQVINSGLPKTDVIPVTLNNGERGWFELSVYPVKDDSGQVINIIEYIKDISDRKNAEQKLERFRKLLDQSNDGIYIINAEDGTFLDVNSAAYSSLGYRLTDLHQMRVWEIDGKIDDKKQWHEMIHQLEATKTSVYESNYRHQNGELIPMEVNAQLVVQDSVKYLIAIARDLTDIERVREQLIKSEQEMRTILDNVDAFIYLKDMDGNYLFANRQVRDLWHAEMDEIIGYGDEKFFDESSASAIRINDKKVLRQGEAVRAVETNTVPQTGQTAVYQSTKLPLRHDDGTTYALCGISLDITEQKRAEDALKESEQRFRIAGQAAFDLIYEWNVETDELKWYGDVDQILGYKKGFLTDDIQSWLQLIHPQDLQLMRNSVELHRNSTKEIRYEYRIRHADGSYRYWKDHALPLLDQDNKPYRWVGVCTDITLQKEHQLQLEHHANHDLLTGLPNRALLSDRLTQAMHQEKRREQRLAVIYIDLDGFKEINDRYGHDVGDLVLIGMSKRFESALRQGDTIARFGGDEFVAVLSDIESREACYPMLRRLMEAAIRPIQQQNQLIQVSASIGVTLYPQDEEVGGDQLLRQADQAMYQAKLAGKNRYSFFDTEYDRSLRGKKEDLQRIRKGLFDNEFELYYQPKVSMRSGQVIGVEALIRWQHPQQGLLMPISFLPVIEDHDIAVEMGEWVLENALAQLSQWDDLGLKTSVSVNIGARQLQRTDFVDQLKKIVQRYPAIASDRLQLEILETSALDDMNHVSKIIHECLEFGVSFALDDFGTGYSSLSYLKHLPATTIKIDRSFVRDMLIDPDDLAILEGILGMATAFRRNVIAEGVETPEHGELLLKLGCDHAQGYGIAKPMPAAEFPAWVKEWRPFETWQHQQRLSRDDLSLLFAASEHRAWINTLEEALRSEEIEFPELDHHQCRFGDWLYSDGQRYDHLTAYQQIVALHQQMHEQAKQLYQQKQQGNEEDLTDGLAKIRDKKQQLLQRMDLLMRNSHGTN
ncbi:MAG: PAS domain S-box protein [Candidatus Thiodiazotropha lotti]|uniref:PAS domain S-box protein n=1 Tax=Candidatus Thiodiazotropha lotti TaxID=2792787 RepID=A0A9E4MZH9_9GAMM|nr:PAS domain S-box protein [Candidatus Thiodiazotropha lotti]MCW4202736.1 PAS domain S-box protein [Candidatus Thiodiazotropha lotti]